MIENVYKDLIRRAKQRLEFDNADNDFDSELYKVELEIQNEDLINVDSERQHIFNKYKYLYENAPLGYFTLNKDGLITEANNAGSLILGLPGKSIINKCFSRFLCPESQMIFSAYKAKASRSLAVEHCDIKLMSKYKAAMYVSLEGQVIESPFNAEQEFLIFATNVSELKLSDVKSKFDYYRQQQQDKRSVMSELAASFAHELNHPLTVILNYVQGCIRRIETGKTDPQDLLKVLKEAADQSARASEIILRMRNQQYNGAMQFEEINLNNLLKDVINLLEYELDKFPLEIRFRPLHSLTVTADKIYLQQAFLNLLRNSFEAMRDANIECPRLIIEVNRISIDKLEIIVEDNGPGLFEVDKHKIFEPNYTTKAYGMGLGLSITQAIIQAHNGIISAANGPFQGALLRIELDYIK